MTVCSLMERECIVLRSLEISEVFIVGGVL